MPGIKSVVWSESNKAKCLDALLNYSSVRVDDDTAQLIAQHIGGGCLPKAIHTLMSNTKRRFDPQNGAPLPSEVRRKPATINGRIAKVTPSKPRTPKKAVPKAERCDSDANNSDDPAAMHHSHTKMSTIHVKQEAAKPQSPPESPTPVACRSSARAVQRIDYRKRLHPNDSDAEGGSSSEDPEPSDLEFKAESNGMDGASDSDYEYSAAV